jgi:thiol:disulfide interchange protein DsbD
MKMKKIGLIILAISYLFILNSNSYAQFGAKKDLVKLEVFKSLDKVRTDSEIKLAVKVNIDDTWHINSNKPNEEFLIPSELRIENKNFQAANIVFPKAEELNFSFSDKPVSVFEKEIVIGVLLHVPEGLEPGNYSVPVTLRYQACNDQTCLPPTSVTKEVDIEVVNNSTPVKEINQEMFSELELSYSPKISESEEGSLGDTLESSGIVLSLILVFLGGLALNLTPCVYPLIPITIGYFGGQSEGRTGKLFTLGILYVLGMALTYSVVGVITSLSGALFGTLLQNPIVIIGVAAVLVALSLSMFGLYEFKMPDAWVTKAGGAKSGAFGAFFMGLTMGIVAAPCIGPFVIGLVTYVAAKGDPFYGFLMFFVLAVGLGIPYLFLALFSGKIKSLPKSGFWMDAVKHIFGFILVGMAIYFLLPLLSESYRDYVLPIYMILASLYLLIFDKVANDIKGFRFFKITFSIILLDTQPLICKKN